MKLMSIIPLSEEQKQKLIALMQSANEQVARRAQLILAYAEGKPTLQAASLAGISRGRARFWKRQFFSRGMGIFEIEREAGVSKEEPAQRLYASGDDFISEPIQAEETNIQELIPYPKPQKSMGIKADDSLAEAGRKVWLYHFALMLNHEQGTLLGEDVEELHDMRVATRRMRTAFDIFEPAFDPKIMKHYLKGLRAIGRTLGAVRDMDVILDYALDYQKSLEAQARPGLDPLIGEWKQIINKKRDKLTKHIHSEAYQKFKQEFNNFLQAPVEEGNTGKSWSERQARIRDIVPVLVYSRYAAVRAYDNVLPTASVIQLHALRIEFKKFRYTLEYFKEILGEGTGEAIREIKQYQDHLGELHDAVVACSLVRDFLKTWEADQNHRPIPERVSPEPIVTYLAHLHDVRYRLMVKFPKLWLNFCRPEFRQNMAQAISKL